MIANARRIPYAALGLGAIALALSRVALTVQHAGQPAYSLPQIAVSTVLVAALLTVLAATALPFVPRPSLAVLGGLVAALFGVGVLALLSIGFLLLLAGGIALFLLSRAARGTGSGRVVASLIVGIVLASGMVVLILVSSQPPLVTCFPGGGSGINGRAWWGGGAQSGPASEWGSPDGRASGTFTQDGLTYRFLCRQGTLVQLEHS